MYSILIKETESVPVLISQNDKSYPDYIMANYEEVTQGTKKYCLDVIADMLTAYAD